MNAKISVFLICVKVIKNLLLYDFHDFTFKWIVKAKWCFWNSVTHTFTLQIQNVTAAFMQWLLQENFQRNMGSTSSWRCKGIILEILLHKRYAGVRTQCYGYIKKKLKNVIHKFMTVNVPTHAMGTFHILCFVLFSWFLCLRRLSWNLSTFVFSIWLATR